jgi:uncharacterized protein (DUF1015 family)
MSRIQPLRGWRYDLGQARADDLNQLLAPPYDVIGPELQADLHRRHPCNIIRLILGQDQAGDQGANNRYSRAAMLLAHWRSTGVLRREAVPALYVLQEHYTLPDGGRTSRWGFIARLKLAPWGQGVLPHERTFPSAKADRLALTIATRSQYNPIFALYADEQGWVQAPLLAACQRPPDAVLNDDDSVAHALWAVCDQQAIGEAIAALGDRVLYVADGHHRYETALNYQRFRRTGALPDSPPPAPLHRWEDVPGLREQAGTAATTTQGFDYALCYLACMADPGVEILPTHRCLHDVPGFDPDRLLEGLHLSFDVVAMAGDQALLDGLHQARSGDRVYALVLHGDALGYLLRPRRDVDLSPLLSVLDHPSVAAIDVAALQALVLGPLLGIGAEPQQQKRYLETVPGAREAIGGTRAGRFQAAFLVNPTTLAQLQAVAHAGQVTPPKTTYFYPKLPSGLVIHALDEGQD